MENDAGVHRDGFPITWLCYDVGPMAEAFVDLLYRGLPLGSRARMSQFEAQHAYVEHPAPMPVGTAISIQAESSPISATVVEIVEQTAGSERPPGMRIRAVLDADAKRAWWTLASGNPAVLDGAAVVMPEPAVETTFEVKPEAKAEAKPEAKIESEPEPKIESEPEAKIESQPEAKLDELQAGSTQVMDVAVPEEPELTSEPNLEAKLDEPLAGATLVMPAMTESGVVQAVSEEENTSVTSSAPIEAASEEVSGVVEVPDAAESNGALDAPEAPSASDAAPRGRGKRKKPNRR